MRELAHSDQRTATTESHDLAVPQTFQAVGGGGGAAGQHAAAGGNASNGGSHTVSDPP